MKLGKNISKSLAKSLAWSLAESPTRPVVWDGLTFTPFGESVDVNPTVTLVCNGSANPNCEYSNNGRQWTAFTPGTAVEFSEPLFVRGLNEGGFSTGESNYAKFTFGGASVKASGDVTSLINQMGEYNELPSYCFYSLFDGNSLLVDISELALPSGIVKYETYKRMFRGTAITTAPALPVIQVGGSSFEEMFLECTSLTDASAIEVTVTGNRSHRYMFKRCESLVTPPSLPCTGLASECYYHLFEKCYALTTAPALPATNVNSYCYLGMFYDCTSLVNAPVLNAVYVGSGGYREMFYHCTSLVNAPALPCTNFGGNYNYASMFRRCSSIVTAPALSATNIPDHCYEFMFEQCSALVNAPALPATTLTNGCYDGMFQSCISLITPPALPATTVVKQCYIDMFHGCTNLASAPELPATTLADDCYEKMFHSCTHLTGPITIGATSPYWSGTETACLEMFYNSGTATGAGGTIKVEGGTVEEWRSAAAIDSAYWTIVAPVPYLKFTSSGTNTVYIYEGTFMTEDDAEYVPSTANISHNCEYSIDDGATWSTMPTVKTSAVSFSGAMYVRGANPEGWGSSSRAPSFRFDGTGSVAIAGNVFSLLDNGAGTITTMPSGSCMPNLFGNNRNWSGLDNHQIVDASGLILPDASQQYSYAYLFKGCKGLVTAPSALPSQALSGYCYWCMFYDCASLITAPEFQATNLVDYCYTNVLNSCPKLTGPVIIRSITSIGQRTASGMFIGTGTARPSTPTDYNKIKVAANASTWNETTAGINPTYWTVELLPSDDSDE